MKFGLVGYQISYSLSPVIHAMIAGTPLSYELIDVSPSELNSDTVHDRLSKLSGFNVTIPHKQTIMQYCNEFDPAAKMIGAVNTVVISASLWTGYNTDYLGFMRSVRTLLPDYLSYHPVLLGYGGAARAVIFALETMGYTTLTVMGGENKAERDAFIGSVQPLLRIKIIGEAPGIPRLWINCTPVGSVKIPEVPSDYIRYRKDDILYDLNYAPYPTFLQKQAEERGVLSVNGMHMLVCQAIEAQNIWRIERSPEAVDVNRIIHSITQ